MSGMDHPVPPYKDPPFLHERRPTGSDTDIEDRIQRIGRELLTDAREHHTSRFSSRFWSDQLMNWAMKDEAFKIQLFRFVDAFPTLTTAESVHDCLVDYLSQPGVTLPSGMALGIKAGGAGGLAKRAMSATVSNRIRALGGNFIAGVDADSAIPKLQKLWDRGVAFSIDLLGEACVSQQEAQVYRDRYLNLLHTLPELTAAWQSSKRLETDHLGPIPRSNVSIKISSLNARTDAIDFEGSLQALSAALEPILEAARDRGVFVNFDMEQFALKDLTIELFERCAARIDFPAGIAMQAYLRSGESDARRIIHWARQAKRQVTVRLIKGAYWDYEVIQAEETGWPIPVWTDKRQTDATFERMAELFVTAMPRSEGQPGVKLALGTHNVRSIAHTLALLEKHGLGESAVEIQMLHGMADQLRAAILQRGLRLREYAPVGQMIPGMAYLVRRLLENTSNQSWLRAGFSDNVPDEKLLASPHAEGQSSDSRGSGGKTRAAVRHQLSPAVVGLDDGKPFFNEPTHDFTAQDRRTRFAAAVRDARAPPVALDTTVEHAASAVSRAVAAFGSWRDVEPIVRAKTLVRAAGLLRDRRDELSGVMIREAGKTWREADADTCEAIDFCDYYARSAVSLFSPQRLGSFVGELNHTWYQPRGVAVVISPWNFPAAICAGMTAAAIVTGNTVIVKPSSQTPGIARILCDIFHQAGVSNDALQFLPGAGSTVGAALVRDPRVSMIAFTGSKEVGLDLIEAAGRTPEGQQGVKKVVCEMGGKNAIVVDESADLDAAVLAVRQSAFGYSGQKCSACSRVIVLDAIHDAFLARLVESTRTLVIGDPIDPATDVGPVIDPAAAAKIRDYIEIGRVEGTLEIACDVPPDLEERIGKPVIGPHVFSGIEPTHRLANEEIFGPVLSVMRASTFGEAIEMANATSYKLTGGVFSRRPSHLEQARREFRVGNLYLNRSITGALVGRQPFGGFGLSGVGGKAGGADYLRQFVEPRACTENTMRHGFAPGLG